MKTVSDSIVFIDTNILYYANNPLESFGKQAITRMQELVDTNNTLAISTQVIREYAHATLRNAIYHKLDLPANIHAVIQNINIFQRDFTVLEDSSEVLDNWISLLPLLTTRIKIFSILILPRP